MKKLLTALILSFSMMSASAATYVDRHGVVYGNICRAGLYYIVLPYAPVGTLCYIDYNGTRWYGAISYE